MNLKRPLCVLDVETTGVDPVLDRTIDRFPGYRFGSDGSVWSAWRRRGSLTYVITDCWRRRKGTPGRKGHMRMKIRLSERIFDGCSVAELILEAFFGARPEGMIARHFPDPDPSNNCIENLSWGTYSQNNGSDRHAQGTAIIGAAHHNVKLTEEKVREIRASYRKGETQVSLARRFGVRQCTISEIIHMRIWTWVK